MPIKYGNTNYSPSGIRKDTYDEVYLNGQKIGKCLCGKRRVRKERFWGTVNPFNRNIDGTMKTHEQVMEKVKAEHDTWMKEPIRCYKCPT